MRTRTSSGRGALAGVLVAVAGGAALAQHPPAYFDYTVNADIKEPPRIFEISRPPTSDTESSATFNFWPGTDFITTDASQINATQATKKTWNMIWMNRWLGGWDKKPNGLNGPVIRNPAGFVCGLEYSTIRLANIATRVEIMFALGYPAHDALDAGYLDYLTKERVPLSSVVNYSDLKSDPDKFFTSTLVLGTTTYAVATDLIVLGGDGTATYQIENNPNCAGIAIDMEPADSRTADEIVKPIQGFARLCHRKHKKLLVMPDALNGSAIKSGLDQTSIPELFAAVDFMTITVSEIRGDIATSFTAQTAYLGPNPDLQKVVISFALGSSTVADAWTIRNIIVQDQLPAVLYFRDYVAQGDPTFDETNQKISVLAFGK
jgi:hypothetical protein